MFPTKAIRGWLGTDDRTHMEIVAAYFEAAGGFTAATRRDCTPPQHRGDPLYAVWAAVR